MTTPEGLHTPRNPIRIVTAAALFDGHDASINIIRRILQFQGAEVIHLGHNRSVDEVVTAVIQEDAQGVAVSSYQGGHVEYFPYLLQALRERGAEHVRIFGGGGGVIVPEEIEELHAAGVTRVFSPEDGQRLGLARMVNLIIEACDSPPGAGATPPVADLVTGGDGVLARALSLIQAGSLPPAELAALRSAAAHREVPVLGITGTGGSGKSSLTDELIRRLRSDQQDKLRIAVLAVDPSRRRGGGALLGDRIRMNSIDGDRVFFRSLATRHARTELPDCLPEMVDACRAAGYDLVIVETPGIGQGDAAIAPLADVSLYVMTADFGAASQLEKIDMLDVADAVAVNKFERRGSEDARRDVARQLVRNRGAFGVPWEEMPVFGTSAASFNDDGVTALYQFLRDRLAEHGLTVEDGLLAPVTGRVSTVAASVVPPARVRYLAEIAETVRGYHAHTGEQVATARRRQSLRTARELLDAAGETVPQALDRLLTDTEAGLDPRSARLLAELARRGARLLGRGAGDHRRGPDGRRAAASRHPVRHAGSPGGAAQDRGRRAPAAVPAG